MTDIKYHAIAWAERKADCYGGRTCDRVIPEWDTYFEGDKQGERFSEPLKLDPKHFPPGTKVTISVPNCPQCHTPSDLSFTLMPGQRRTLETPHKCECGFDWKEWELNQYA